MRMVLIGLTASLFCSVERGASRPGGAGQSTDVSTNLVFTGTVQKIFSSPSEPPSLTDWVVRFRVEQIESGNYTHAIFEFRVHSPVRSRLKVGESYQVEAQWNGIRYVVDENQWLTLRLSYKDLTKIRDALTEYLGEWENDDAAALFANTKNASILNLARTGPRIGLWTLDADWPDDADEVTFVWRNARTVGPAFTASLGHGEGEWHVLSVNHLFLHPLN